VQAPGATTGISDRNPRFPVVLVVTAALMMLGLMAWSRWEDYAAGNARSAEVSLAAKRSQVVARILHLDEVLTMSARMAAATGDKAWIDRYEQFEPELDRLINEAKSLTPSVEGLANASATDQANEELVRMEKASLEWVRQNRKDEAWALLTGPEYQRQKEIYADGMRAFAAEVQARQDNSEFQDEQHQRASFIAKAAASGFVIMFWCLALWKAAFAWRRKAEQYRAAADSLRASEQRHRTLFESSRDALMTLAPPSWKFTSANPAALAMFGAKDVAEFTSLGPWQLSPEVQPDGRPSAEKAKDAIETAMREGSHFFEWTHRRLSGEEFPATVLLTRLELAGQALLRATVRDITAQKRAEAEVSFQNLLLSTEQEASIDGILVVDKAGRLLSFNRRFVDMWGIPPGVVEAKSDDLALRTVIDKLADPQAFLQKVKFLYENPHEASRDEIALRDGRFLDRYSAPMVGADGESYGRVWYFRDITDRKQAEKAVQQAKDAAQQETAKLSAMISGMEEGVVFANADNVIVEINDYLCRFVGKTREEILGKRIEDFHCGKVLDSVLGHIRRFRETAGSKPFVLQRNLGGAELILRMQPIYRDDRYDGVLLNAIDVTELVKARRQAETANAAKTAFLANMSHEIRSPMTAMLGFAEIIGSSIECCTTCPEHKTCTIRVQNKEHIRIIRRNGEHLLELINDILDISKIEAGKFVMDVQECSLPAVIADVISMIRVRAEQHNISLSVEYETEIPETVRTDGARVRQALVNLVGNAIKFTERGGVRMVASFLPAWRDGRPAVEIKVIDTGIGIAEENLAQLFQPFVQADASTSRKYGGTGLGLAISRHLAELLGGQLVAESTVGKGSTFTLTLPVGNLEGVRMLQDPAEAVHGEAAGSCVPAVTDHVLAGTRVLVAEDGPDNQRLIRTILSAAGAQVELAADGREAVAKAQAASFDVVLMDMQMPGMDGYEATRTLRSQGYAVPILALTAHAMAGDREKCLAAGCTDHLTKPVDRAGLVIAVARHGGREVPYQCHVAPPPAAPASDSEAVRSQYAADPDLAEILAQFVNGLAGQVEAMSFALKAGRHEELQRLAHRMKGAGGSYGYPSLTEAARELGAAARAGDVEAAGLALGRLAALARAVVRGMSPELVSKEVAS